jgi:hypothetical protein
MRLMATVITAKLIGGPLGNRSITVPEGTNFGDIIEIPANKESHGAVTLQTKHHYRFEWHPTEQVVANWVNPADRRQHGR